MEQWRRIPNLLGYEASNEGRIKSVDRTLPHARFGIYNRKGKILTQSVSKGGYLRVGVSTPSKLVHFLVHRLVASAWHDNPENKRTINHVNGIKTDNRPDNLEWNTHLENVHHSINVGTKKQARGVQFSTRVKLDELQVRVIKSIRYELSDRKLASYFGVNRITINDIFNGRSWKHISV